MLQSYAFVLDTVRVHRAPARRSVAEMQPRQRAAARPKAVQAPILLDRPAARAMVEAGYMPLQRYVELFDDSLVTPPYNALNFGEGDV